MPSTWRAGRSYSQGGGDEGSGSRKGGSDACLFSSFHVGVQRRARADEIAVAVDIVDAVDRRPVLVDPAGPGWETGGLAAVGPAPFSDQILDRVGGILQ